MEREDERLVKCATVSLIGRPSVGKSTLVNTICEMKVSITASTPQTTRNAIRGIYTDQRGQLIFTDTPGYHLGGREINRRMQEITVSSLDDSDVVLYLMDARREAGAEEDAIIGILQKVRVPVVAGNTEADRVKAHQRSSELTCDIGERVFDSCKEHHDADIGVYNAACHTEYFHARESEEEKLADNDHRDHWQQGKPHF